MLVPASASLAASFLMGQNTVETGVEIPVPSYEVGEVFRDCDACPEMVVIPAGTFMMGSDEGGSYERPVHAVRIPYRFAVGKYEVTFMEWDACVSDGGCSHRPDDMGWGRGARPVIDVSWEDAQEYAVWLSRETGEDYRLLSESEWEYAARSGTTTRYYFGDEISPGEANYDYSEGRTVPVGSYPANEYGLHDMHGNVWEWVEDCWHDDYRGAPEDGSAWTACLNSWDRVQRGGSWDSGPWGLRSANRNTNNADIRVTFSDGFRIARTLAP